MNEDACAVQGNEALLVSEAHKVLSAMGILVALNTLETEQWEQTWSTPDCGFEGRGGQEFTQATTTVVTSKEVESVVVFHNDKLAYLIKEPTPRFLSDLEGKVLVGKARLHRVNYDRATESLPT